MDLTSPRCVFKSADNDVYLVADAYEGSQIKVAVTDFLSAAAGVAKEKVSFKIRSEEVSIAIAGDADLVVYVGHDAFMDFQIPPIAGIKGEKPRQTIVLACASKSFFAPYIRQTGRQTSFVDDRPDGPGSIYFEGGAHRLGRQRK